MNRTSIVFTSLFALCLVAPVGCAVQDGSDDAAEQETATDDAQLSAAAKSLVGKYTSDAPIFGGFGRLELKANGKYVAQVDPAGTAVCVTAPCLLPESGTWSATKRSNGTFRLSIRTPGRAARIYTASKFDASIDWTSGITLERNGKTETLNAVVAPPAACCDPATKPAGGIEGTWCCGDGSWQYDIGSGDQAISCSANGGGGQVCGGEKCGATTCGAGTSCCNPLAGICTPPGMACAF
jgi:hypothetical protein